MLREPDVVEHTRSMLQFNDIPAPPAALPRGTRLVVPQGGDNLKTLVSPLGDNPSFQAPLAWDPAGAVQATEPRHVQRLQGSQHESSAAAGSAGQRAEGDMQLELMSKILQQMETLNQTVSVMDRRLQLVEERMSYIEGSEQPE